MGHDERVEQTRQRVWCPEACMQAGNSRLSVAVAFDYISSNLYLFINNTHVISLTPALSALIND
jgi:hypothetical protein